jgi:putative flippase GtrA
MSEDPNPQPEAGARLRRLARQALGYLFVGGAGFGVDYGLLKLMVGFGIPPLAARTVSIAVAIVFTWLLNRRFTFAVRTPPTLRELGHYTAISLGGALLNYTIFSVAVLLGSPLAPATMLGTLGAIAFNFVRYRALLASR